MTDALRMTDSPPRRSRLFWLVWFVVLLAALTFMAYWLALFEALWPTVSGKVELPERLPESVSIRLSFVPEGMEGGKTRYAYAPAKDRTFTVKLPPGKYKVGISVGQLGEGDKWESFFDVSSPVFNPITFEVTRWPPRQHITVGARKKDRPAD